MMEIIERRLTLSEFEAESTSSRYPCRILDLLTPEKAGESPLCCT